MKIKNKNIGPFLKFNKQWFEDHQKILLFLLNFPILSIIFRYCLRIEEKKKLSEIAPNFYTYKNDDGTLTSTFRTHDKYAKRLYFAFGPLWWVLHFFDWLVLDRLVPEYSFGFSELTAYPQAGGGGSNISCDGFVSAINTSGSSWINIRNGSGCTLAAYPTNQEYAMVQVTRKPTFDYWSQIIRGCFTFNTSSIGSSSTISSASIYLLVTGKYNAFSYGDNSVDVVSFSPANKNNLVSTDYYTSCFGETSFSNKTYANISTQYNEFALDSNGVSNIIKDGVSAFGTRFGCDRSNSEPYCPGPTYNTTYVYVSFADYTGTSSDPYLSITYTASSSISKIAGVAQVSVSKIGGVAIASTSKVGGVSNT